MANEIDLHGNMTVKTAGISVKFDSSVPCEFTLFIRIDKKITAQTLQT